MQSILNQAEGVPFPQKKQKEDMLALRPSLGGLGTMPQRYKELAAAATVVTRPSPSYRGGLPPKCFSSYS